MTAGPGDENEAYRRAYEAAFIRLGGFGQDLDDAFDVALTEGVEAT